MSIYESYIEIVLSSSFVPLLVSDSEFERMKADKRNDREGIYNVFVDNFHPDSKMQIWIDWDKIAWMLVARGGFEDDRP